MDPAYKTRPREVWSRKQCLAAVKHRHTDSYGSKGPAGLIQGSADPYPQYGTQRFNGGIIAGDVWYTIGTRYPWPKIPAEFGLYHLCSWGVIVSAREDAVLRKLDQHELVLDEEGYEK
jgi:hypothetical protein